VRGHSCGHAEARGQSLVGSVDEGAGAIARWQERRETMAVALVKGGVAQGQRICEREEKRVVLKNSENERQSVVSGGK